MKKGFENPLLKKMTQLQSVKSQRHRTVIDVFRSLRSLQVGFFDFFLFRFGRKKIKKPNPIIALSGGY